MSFFLSSKQVKNMNKVSFLCVSLFSTNVAYSACQFISYLENDMEIAYTNSDPCIIKDNGNDGVHYRFYDLDKAQEVPDSSVPTSTIVVPPSGTFHASILELYANTEIDGDLKISYENFPYIRSIGGAGALSIAGAKVLVNGNVDIQGIDAVSGIIFSPNTYYSNLHIKKGLNIVSKQSEYSPSTGIDVAAGLLRVDGNVNVHNEMETYGWNEGGQSATFILNRVTAGTASHKVKIAPFTGILGNVDKFVEPKEGTDQIYIGKNALFTSVGEYTDVFRIADARYFRNTEDKYKYYQFDDYYDKSGAEKMTNSVIDNAGIIRAEKANGINWLSFAELRYRYDPENRPISFSELGEDRYANEGNKARYRLHVTNSGEISAPNGSLLIASVHDDTFTSNGGKLEGKIEMLEGDDEITLNDGESHDFSKLYEINGNGYNNYPIATPVRNIEGHAIEDILITPRPYTTDKDTLNINTEISGSTESVGKNANDVKLTSIDVINIGNNSQTGRLNLTGDMVKPNLGYSEEIYRFYNYEIKDYSDTDDHKVIHPRLADKVNNDAQLNIGTHGVLALAKNIPSVYIAYKVLNNGTIDLTQGASTPSGKMTLLDDYVSNAGKLLVKSIWNQPDEQQNDLLVIKGTNTGETTVLVQDDIIKGNVEVNDLGGPDKNGLFKSPVVTIDGQDNGKFVGNVKTALGYNAQLTKKGNSYYWTLKAALKPEPIQPIDSLVSVLSADNNYVDILDESISGYLQANQINRDMALEQIANLHKRIGNQAEDRTEHSWARLQSGKTILQGKERFGNESKQHLLQFGQDLFVENNGNSHVHTGVMLSYSWANSDFYDKYRAKDGVIIDNKYAGKLKSNLISLGAYRTWYNDNHYIDVVGNLSWLHNKFQSYELNASQNGYAAGASIEYGYKFPLSNSSNWTIEPQLQLTYQFVKLKGVNDGIHNVKTKNSHNVVGRVGSRLVWTNPKNKADTLYLRANLVQNLTDNRSQIQIANNQVMEKFARTKVELELGGQVKVSKNISLYADVGVQKSLDRRNQVFKDSSVAKTNYNAKLGVKITW